MAYSILTSGWKKKLFRLLNKKAKEAEEDISVFFAAAKSAIKGEQPKALQIIEAEKKKTKNSVQVVNNADSKQNESESVDKVEITQAEFEQLVALKI